MNRLLITAFAAASIAQAAESDHEGIAFFESRVRPALAKYCYECHSAESGKTKGTTMEFPARPGRSTVPAD